MTVWYFEALTLEAPAGTAPWPVAGVAPEPRTSALFPRPSMIPTSGDRFSEKIMLKMKKGVAI
jgi:hypothetical protein